MLKLLSSPLLLHMTNADNFFLVYFHFLLSLPLALSLSLYLSLYLSVSVLSTGIAHPIAP